MFPLRDTIPSRRTPVVTIGLIAVNLAAFAYQLGLGPGEMERLFLHWGIVPARYADPELGRHFGLLDQLAPFVTSLFLHGGFLHVLGNLWMLWIFGDNVEDWFGRAPFLAFYLFCGVAAGLMHLGFHWGSPVPTIGASGAIAGVMGAYFLLYPQARVKTLVPIFFFLTFLELPAWVFLGLWFLLQFLSAAASGGGAAAGIAWWAHVGGFVAGAAVVFFLGGARPRKPQGRRATLKPLWEKVDEYW